MVRPSKNINHGLSRRSLTQAEWTRRKAAWRPRRYLSPHLDEQIVLGV
jgi:hypothetical protein